MVAYSSVLGRVGAPIPDNFPGVSSTVDVLDGNFHHIAGTWNGSTIELYVDGSSQGTVPLSTPGNNTRAMNFGFAWGGGTPQRFFRGQVDELSIYNRALNLSEIQAIFNAGSAGKYKVDHFLCYKAKPAKGQPKHDKVLGLFVNNQFDPEQAERLDTVTEEELCVPATKTLPDSVAE